MINKIKFELNRIFSIKINLIVMIIFFVLCLLFIFSNSNIYKNFQQEKDSFIEYERNRVEKFVNFDQYGSYGFRVLFEPAPLSILFNESTVFDNLQSIVDMTEILKIESSLKGQNLFNQKGNFTDFSGLFFLVGSVLMLFLAITSYKSEKHFFKFGNLIIRLVILIFITIGILVLSYLFLKIPGIKLSGNETNKFTGFSLYLISFLGFFFSGGIFIRVLSKNRQITYIFAFVFWFISIIVIPALISQYTIKNAKLLPANEEYNIVKLEEVMNFERKVKKAVEGLKDLDKINEVFKKMTKDFFATGYKKNTKIENNLNSDIERIVKKHERISILYPTSFYNFLSGTLSSKAYFGYLDFVKYILNLRHKFVQFILFKRYESTDKDVESFVKGNENIFKAQSRLPKTFFSGLVLTLLYTVILFAASYFVLSRKLKPRKDIEDPQLKPGDEEGEMYFVLCENEEYKNKIYEFYQGDKNAVCIDNITGRLLDPGIALAKTFKYFCQLKGVDEDRAAENLEILGIEDITKEKKSDEAVKKIYCAVCFAKDVEKIVINDFIDRESRDFERKFLELIEHAQEGEKTVIYLNTQIYYFDSPFTGDIKVNKFKKFKIEKPTSITLR